MSRPGRQDCCLCGVLHLARQTTLVGEINADNQLVNNRLCSAGWKFAEISPDEHTDVHRERPLFSHKVARGCSCRQSLRQFIEANRCDPPTTNMDTVLLTKCWRQDLIAAALTGLDQMRHTETAVRRWRWAERKKNLLSILIRFSITVSLTIRQPEASLPPELCSQPNDCAASWTAERESERDGEREREL